jgi:hypothetical protein
MVVVVVVIIQELLETQGLSVPIKNSFIRSNFYWRLKTLMLPSFLRKCHVFKGFLSQQNIRASLSFKRRQTLYNSLNTQEYLNVHINIQ